jgi:hypothetical protein
MGLKDGMSEHNDNFDIHPASDDDEQPFDKYIIAQELMEPPKLNSLFPIRALVEVIHNRQEHAGLIRNAFDSSTIWYGLTDES